MDRKWMRASRLSKEYEDGVDEFVRFTVEHANDPTKIICPCLKCCYGRQNAPHIVKDHLFCYGIDKSYTVWTRHGEVASQSTYCGSTSRDTSEFRNITSNEFVGDQFDDMVKAVEEDLHDCPEMFDKLKLDSEEPLYQGCKKFTRLSFTLKLYNLKASNGWSDKSFTELLKLLKEVLPDENVLPCKTYEAKQILCSIGMTYERIHACPNDCILYQNEYASYGMCPKCNAPRYKNTKLTSPAKVVWYFPIIPRFRRMFRSTVDAKLLTWHANERIKDGKLRHPADSPQWRKIDFDYPEFGEEARNLRLVLSTDGMNPHGNQRSSHSTWPVILMIYNLPPWLCMKRKYMMLTMLISGPKQPGNDIDVYLRPFIDDMKVLWHIGVEVYDGFEKETFVLKAMLFGTINDFPAYGNLSGYSTKGKTACPICEDNTCWERLQHSQKNVFLGHRRFLPIQHRYRTWRKAFNGKSEEGRAPMHLAGKQIFEKVDDLEVTFGKPFSKDLSKIGWKKKSIFFDLPYWEALYVRHFLDVMHIEKNVCDSVIGTLLNVPGKTKDGIKSRLDLSKMGIREELRPIKKGLRTYLPPASHTLSRKEKIAFCDLLSGIKVPDGYSSNIKNLVSMKDLKLIGLKSHDSHILIQHLMPVALRGILPKKVRATLIKLCLFFKTICSKVIDPGKLPELQKDAIVMVCELEMYFPPSFFDIMVHLIVHLVKEIQLCGPAFLRWMYPIERFMKILKGYVKSRSRPEGCIVERYITEEAVEFCTEFISNAESIGMPKSRHTGRMGGEGIIGNEIVDMPCTLYDQAHLYVLHNIDEVTPYIEYHKRLLRCSNRNKNEDWISKEHNRSFITWLKDHICSMLENDSDSVSERLRWLSKGPCRHVLSYNGYLINGHTFYTKDQDSRSTMQNSGVTLVAESMHVSSAKDKNPIYAKMHYYGIIERIYELDYTMFRVPIFSCNWVDNKNAVRLDEFGFTLVDLNRTSYKDEPFILASQARQIFFVTDPSDKRWSVVLPASKRNMYEEDEQEFEYDVEDTFPHHLSGNDESSGDIDHYVRIDHAEGIWVTSAVRDQYKYKHTRSNAKLLGKRKR